MTRSPEQRTKCLVLIRCYLPGYKAGGPVRTLANMVEQLSDEVDFRIVTLSRDLGDAQDYTGIAKHTWTSRGGAQVLYVPPQDLSVWYLSRLVAAVDPHVVYLNSFFDRYFSQRVLLGRSIGLFRRYPLIVAPRNEFAHAALSIKRNKKKLYLQVAQLLRVGSDAIWQASSAAERDDIVRGVPYVASDSIRIAMDLPSRATSTPLETQREKGRPLRVCFLSRIAQIKNLDYALRVIAAVKEPLDFDIYGPIEDQEYWNACSAYIAKMPVNKKVKYHGQVQPEHVLAVLREYDLFLLPSRGENFGHVIVEALAAGVPVLTSDQTPWKSLQEAGAGWALGLLDSSAFSSTIERICHWTADQHLAARRHAAQFARSLSSDERLREDSLRLIAFALENNQVTDKAR